MWNALRAEQWRPDERTLGFVLFGFSLVSAASALIFANSDFAVLFNVPPEGAANGAAFQYTVAEQMDAASAFIQGCAAAFAALGALGIFAQRRWGAPLAIAALAVEVLAFVVSMVSVPGGALVIGRLIETAWLVVLIMLITGLRVGASQRGRATSTAPETAAVSPSGDEPVVTTEDSVSADAE